MATKKTIKSGREFVLAQIGKDESSKDVAKKIPAPVIEVDDELLGKINEYNTIHDELVASKEKEDALKCEIIPEATKLFQQEVLENGFKSSINLGGKLLFTPTNRYAVNGKNSSDLEGFFPAEILDDDKYFTEEITLNVKKSIINNERELKKLINLIGEENFNRWFEVKHTLKPTATAHQERWTKPDTLGANFTAAEAANVLTSSFTLKKA